MTAEFLGAACDSFRNTFDIANPVEGQLRGGRWIKRLDPRQVTLLREQALHLVDRLPQRLTPLVEQTHDAVEAVSQRDQLVDGYGGGEVVALVIDSAAQLAVHLTLPATIAVQIQTEDT